MTDFSLENALTAPAVGVDEVGCGPWAGPVVAGAAYFPDQGQIPKSLLDLVTDSKKLSAAKRQTLAQLLWSGHGTWCYCATAFVDVPTLDRMNIRQAAHLAMLKAIMKIYQEVPGLDLTHVLVDGPLVPKMDLRESVNPSLTKLTYHPIVKGDSHSFSIAAASIVAKVARDQEMIKLAQLYPGYGWERNAGYGTTAHQQGLARLGLTPQHRHSFKPIQALLQESKRLA